MHRRRLIRVLMVAFVLAMCVTAVAFASTSNSPPSQPSSDTSVLVYLAGGALAGGLVKVAADGFNAWRRRSRGELGPTEEMITRITKQALEGAEISMRELRADLEVAKREIASYREQIADLNRLGGASGARIERLETDLTGALTERDLLRSQLTEARAEITELRSRIVQLESPPAPQAGRSRRSTD